MKIIGYVSWIIAFVSFVANIVRNAVLVQRKFGFVKGDIFIYDGIQIGLFIAAVVFAIIGFILVGLGDEHK